MTITAPASSNGPGSSAQRDALARVAQLSEAVHAAENAVGNDDWATGLLEQARWRVLRAETSCNFYWGEAWVRRCHDDLDEAGSPVLDQALNAAAAVALEVAAQSCANVDHRRDRTR